MKAKKLLSLLVASIMIISSMASLAITANAVEAITDFTYSLLFTTVPTANDTADIKDTSNNTVMTVTYLGGTWKAVGDGIAPAANADRPSGSKYTSGCAIQFVPASNGDVLVDRKLGGGKTLKIDENGVNKYSLTNNGSSSVYTKNAVSDYTFYVEAGNTYIAYATGTGDEYYGIYFEPSSSSTHTLSGTVNRTGTTDTTGWKIVFTNARDSEVQKVAFGSTYSIEAKQNRTYDITLEDADGNAPFGTTVSLDTNSIYVGKENVTHNINVVDVAEETVTGLVTVHDINNDNESLDLTGVTLTFTDKNDSAKTYTSTALTDNKYSVTLMSGKEYTVTANGAAGYDLSPLSKEYTFVAGDPSPFKNILFTETLGAVDFASTVQVGPNKKYARINDAITAIKKMTRTNDEEHRVTIEIDPGTYTEQVIVDTPYVTLKAADETQKPTIQWYYGVGYLYYSVKPTAYTAKVNNVEVTLYRGYYSEDYAVAKTQKTAVDRWGTACRVTGTNVYVENLIFKNTLNCQVTAAEKADGVEPAMNNEYSDTNGKPDRTTEDFDPLSRAATERAAAIAFDGDNFEAYNCEFISSQDTFYTGKNGYVKDCYIEGGTDYIFGGNSVVFDNCTLAWHGYSDVSADGHLTANKNSSAPVAGTPDLGTNGYLLKDCTITNSKYFTGNQFAAGDWGRNWGAASCQVVYDGITLDGVDVPKGWVSMGSSAPLSGSILYVNDLTDKNGAAVDVSGTTHNPNGTMAANNYKLMSMTDYFGTWTPPHYEASTEPDDPSATSSPEATTDPSATSSPEATADPSATSSPEATTDPGATSSPEATADPSATSTPEATTAPADDNVTVAPAGGVIEVTALPLDTPITFDTAGSYGTPTKVGDYLAVYGAEGGVISADTSGKTIDGVQYPGRLKTGGAAYKGEETDVDYGTIKSRMISITPAVAGTLNVTCSSSNSSDVRKFAANQDNKVIKVWDVPGTAATYSVNVEAGKPVYLYSSVTGGVNIYGITLTEATQATEEPVDDDSISCTKIVATYADGALTNVVITPGNYTAEEIRNAAASNTATQKTLYWKSLSGETVDIEPITPPTPAPTPEPEPDWDWTAASDPRAVKEADREAGVEGIKAGDTLISGLTTLFDNASTNKTYIYGVDNGTFDNPVANSSTLKYVAAKDGILAVKIIDLGTTEKQYTAAICEAGASVEAAVASYTTSKEKETVILKGEVEAGKTYYITAKGTKVRFSAAAFTEQAVSKKWAASDASVGMAANTTLIPGLTTLFANNSTSNKYITAADNGKIEKNSETNEVTVTGSALKYEPTANGTLKVTMIDLGSTNSETNEYKSVTPVIYDATEKRDVFTYTTTQVKETVDLTADVVTGHIYYVTATGTKGRFSAASFTPAATPATTD